MCRLAARQDETLLGWAALSPVSRRQCYAGVAEASVYVAATHRGAGIGKALLLALIAESERHGIWTLQGATFADNTALNAAGVPLSGLTWAAGNVTVTR